MSEVKKRKIVIASILKPVDDARMSEKIGQSLSSVGEYEIHIIGFPSPASVTSTSLQFHPLPYFKRLSITRLIAPWLILAKIWSIKPALFMITTHELLIVGTLAKFLVRCKLVYDVQENYQRNIRYTNAFPPFLRLILSAYVGLKEAITTNWVDHFFMAEKAYLQELKFINKRKSTVLENKLKYTTLSVGPARASNNFELLFSGTLADSTGVFIAIEMAVKLHRFNPDIHLTIIGYAAQAKTLKEIKDRIHPFDFITLIGGDTLVPHAQILQHITIANFGIVAYPPNPATAGSIPTKLYEYLGHKLPVILINHKPWVALCKKYDAAVVFNYPDTDYQQLYQAMTTMRFYSAHPQEVLWHSEEPRLFQAIKQLI